MKGHAACPVLSNKGIHDASRWCNEEDSRGVGGVLIIRWDNLPPVIIARPMANRALVDA